MMAGSPHYDSRPAPGTRARRHDAPAGRGRRTAPAAGMGTRAARGARRAPSGCDADGTRARRRLGRGAVRAGCARRRARRRGALASPRDDARPCGGAGTRRWLRRSRAICCAAGDPVLLLGSDVLVRGPLDDLARLAREHGAVLVPRRDSPLPDDGRRPDAADMAKLGAYDDAIVGVAGDGERVRCLVGASRGRELARRVARTHRSSTSRRPSFATRCVDDPAHGCARWNLDVPSRTRGARPHAATRRLRSQPAPSARRATGRGAARAAERASRPGADLPRPRRAPRAAGQRCDESPALRPRSSRVRPGARQPRACPLQRGGRVRAPVAAIRSHPIRTTRPKPTRFARGWRSPSCALPMASRSVATCTRSTAVAATYRGCFPICGRRPARSSSGPTATGAASSAFPPRCCRHASRLDTPQRIEALRDGVNVAGYFRSEFGVGEAARLLVDGLDAAGIPHVTRTYTRAPTRHGQAFEDRGDGHPYATNIVCVNVDRIEQFAVRCGARVLRRTSHRRLLVVGGRRSARASAPGARCRRRGLGRERVRSLADRSPSPRSRF